MRQIDGPGLCVFQAHHANYHGIMVLKTQHTEDVIDLFMINEMVLRMPSLESL